MINTLYPGRPNYTGPTSGIFAFVHHEVLAESSHNINERIAYIKEHKPTNERESRLYHLLYIDIPELAKAYEDWDKACKDWEKAYKDWVKANEDLDKARKDCDKASEDLDKANEDWDKALNNFKLEILAYVNKHIPDHKWDGKELRFK